MLGVAYPKRRMATNPDPIMHTFKAEILASHFNTTAEAMLQHNQTGFVGLFKVDGKHFTCVAKGHPVPVNGFTYVADVTRDGATFEVYRAHPKAFARFVSTR